MKTVWEEMKELRRVQVRREQDYVRLGQQIAKDAQRIVKLEALLGRPTEDGSSASSLHVKKQMLANWWAVDGRGGRLLGYEGNHRIWQNVFEMLYSHFRGRTTTVTEAANWLAKNAGHMSQHTASEYVRNAIRRGYAKVMRRDKSGIKEIKWRS